MKRQMAMLGALAVVLAAGAKPSFFLPERIFAAPGLELNVYYKNVFDSVVPQNFAYEATCRKGCAELARWCFTPEAATKLVEELCSCRMPYVCPRGKPVMIFTSNRELDRKFDRA